MYSISFSRCTIIERVKVLLDSKEAGIICILLAFLNKVAIAWLFTSLEDDKSLYLLFSQSFLKGKAFLEPVNFVGHSATEYIYNPAAFSPLYSVISAPFLYISNSFVAASILMDIISWSSFIIVLYKIARLLLPGRWIANLFILTVGFFLYPHELASTPKDTLSIGLILWACYGTYKMIISSKLQLPLVVLTSLIYVLFALTKFLYAPLVIVFLFILFYNAVKDKSRHQWYHALIPFTVLVVSFVMFSFFLTYQRQISSSFSINSDGTTFIRGFYPENLLYIFPFVTSSIINTNFWGVQLERLFHIPFIRVSQLFQLLDGVVIGTALFFVIRYYREIKKVPVLFLILGAVAAAIIYMVCYMSLTHKAQDSESGPGYTYVMEARSFFFIMLVLQLVAFRFIFQSTVWPGFRLLLFSFFLLEGLHGAYFTLKQLINQEKVMAHQRMSSPKKRVIYRLSHLEKGDQLPALITSENNLRRLALVNGLKAYSLPKECSAVIKTNKPAVVALPVQDTATFNTCIPKNRSFLYDTVFPYVLLHILK